MSQTMSAKCGGLIVLMLLFPMPLLTARADAYDVLSGLIGHSKAELIQRLGPPSDTITTIDGERLIYETLDAGRVGGISGRNTRAGGPDDFRSFSRSYAFRCRTEVVIAAGHVRAFNRRGNDCR